jgi:predicted Zn finger-like uncharacterized protein
MITVCCPSCQTKLAIKDEWAGEKVKCPRCGQVVAVPAAVPSAPVGADGRTLPTNPEPPSKVQPPADANPPTHPGTNILEATREGQAPEGGPDGSLTDFLSPPQADDELGRLGKYRILKVLGHGGMGIVYRAEDPILRRFVAIKAMLPGMAASASAGKRFLREAQTLAAVEHDHIVRIHDVAEDRGVPFLAMEFLKGEPLDVRVERDKVLPPGRSCASAGRSPRGWPPPTSAAWSTATSSPPTSGWRRRRGG